MQALPVSFFNQAGLSSFRSALKGRLSGAAASFL
jgi:hypothetical protein